MKNKIFKTATLVTALSVAERSLGFLYRIVLARMIGAEALGSYQVALSVFAVFLTIGTGGIPVTVSRLISKSKAEGKKNGETAAVLAGVALALLLTLPVVLVFPLSGNAFSFLFTDENGLAVFKTLLWGLIFSCLYAVFRGWLWGKKKFLTAAVFEILEESVMVVAGILLLRRVHGSLEGAKTAALAAVISYLFSFTCSALCFFFGREKSPPDKGYIKPLAKSALPITAVRAGTTLVNSAVAVLLPAMLIRAGMQESEALKLFGVLSGMVIPILFVPSTVIGSISLVLVPELSEDFYAHRTERLQRNIERGLNAAVLVACALIPFFSVLGEELGLLAFSSLESGKMIEKSCPILLPMSLTMISTSALNSMGFEKQTFRIYFVGAAAMLLSVCLLPKFLGGYAYIVGMALNFTLCAILNLRFLFKKALRGCKTDFFKRTLFTVALVLPLALVGELYSLFFHRVFGELLSDISVTLSMAGTVAVALLVFYFLFRKKQQPKKIRPYAKPQRAKG